MDTMKADRPSIIRRFSLSRVNGYKNIEIDFPTSTKVISAENGSGKTTLLNALYGLLSGRRSYLRKIDFESLSIEFFDGHKVSATKKEVLGATVAVSSLMSSGDWSFFFDHGITEDDLIDLLTETPGGLPDIDDSPILRRFYRDSPHSRPAILEKLSELHACLLKGEEVINPIYAKIQSALAGHEVLYFPTYRRIEMEAPEAVFRDRHRRSPYWRQSDSGYYGDGDETSLINFGLKDVERKLKTITDDIRRGTFEAYARISGKRRCQQIVLARWPEASSSRSASK